MKDARTAVRRNDGLRRLREGSGRSQAQLAAEVGYSSSHYAMVEREPRLLRQALAAKLAMVLGLELDDLLRLASGAAATVSSSDADRDTERGSS